MLDIGFYYSECICTLNWALICSKPIYVTWKCDPSDCHLISYDRRLHRFFHFNQQSQLIFTNPSTHRQNLSEFNVNAFLASFPLKNNMSIFPNFRRFTHVSDTWTFFPTFFYAHINGHSERIFQHFFMLSGSFESYWGPVQW